MNNRILYFIDGEVPTGDEFADAEQYMAKGPLFDFISLKNFDLNGPIIENVGAYGKVPDSYKSSALPNKKLATKGQ